MRIHHLNCGTFCPVGRWLVNGRGGLLSRGRVVCHCQLVETNAGLVLIDTGLGLDDIADPMSSLPGLTWQAIMHAQLRREETAIEQVRDLGFQPDRRAAHRADAPGLRPRRRPGRLPLGQGPRLRPRVRRGHRPGHAAGADALRPAAVRPPPRLRPVRRAGRALVRVRCRPLALRPAAGDPARPPARPLPRPLRRRHRHGNAGPAAAGCSTAATPSSGTASWTPPSAAARRPCGPTRTSSSSTATARMHNQQPPARPGAEPAATQVHAFCSHDPEMMRQFAGGAPYPFPPVHEAAPAGM